MSRVYGDAGIGALSGPSRSYGSDSASRKSDEDGGLLGGLGKSDFLKLLVAQLRNQDPLKPMEDREFIAQMAQLNTVEQIMAMNENLSQFMSFDIMAQASSLIGKVVEASPAGRASIVGPVQEVRLGRGKPVLIVDGQEVGMGDITRIGPAT